LLFHVATLLAASVAFNGMAGALVVPEKPRFDVTQSALDARAAPSGTRAPSAVDASSLPDLGGRALLDQISMLPVGEVEAHVRGNPLAISKLLLHPPTAKSVYRWWALTSDELRQSLVDVAPELVGNLDGLPMALRDDANRDFLRRSIVEVEASLPALGRATKADAERRLHMLKEIEEALITTSGQPERSLLSVDTAWPGRAAVVVGDLETADYVSYMVPGMFFTVDGQMVDWTVIAQDLYDEKMRWVEKLGRDDPSLRGASVATVSWIGYQTPGIMEIASLDLAEDGAKFLSSSVDGVQTTRTDNPYITLSTHSYGSTATLMAIADGAVKVDALVMIGSPGSAAQSVSDLRMPSDRVFVGEAAWDPVVHSAFFGSDPGSDSFGAQHMSVDGGVDPETGAELSAAIGHLGYFDAGTEAMRNMALVGLNRGDLVTGAPKPEESLFAGLW
jgi:hypothetical protein